MKHIPLRFGDKFSTHAVVDAVAGQRQAQKVEEMRRRCRILDALENASPTGMMIEDADYAHLVKLVNDFEFGLAHPELLTIIDGILTAGPPPAVVVPPATPEYRETVQ
jgi:hypothetical protein